MSDKNIKEEYELLLQIYRDCLTFMSEKNVLDEYIEYVDGFIEMVH